MQHSLLLIVADDVIAAALLGGAAESIGLRVAFPRTAESPRDALRRARPRAVVLECGADCRHALSLIGPAIMLGARVVLVGSRAAESAMRQMARAHHLAAFVLPAELDALVTDLRADVRHPAFGEGSRTEA